MASTLETQVGKQFTMDEAMRFGLKDGGGRNSPLARVRWCRADERTGYGQAFYARPVDGTAMFLPALTYSLLLTYDCEQ
jgi:hypothetical protein